MTAPVEVFGKPDMVGADDLLVLAKAMFRQVAIWAPQLHVTRREEQV